MSPQQHARVLSKKSEVDPLHRSGVLIFTTSALTRTAAQTDRGVVAVVKFQPTKCKPHQSVCWPLQPLVDVLFVEGGRKKRAVQ